jgi:hypothetical protein
LAITLAPLSYYSGQAADFRGLAFAFFRIVRYSAVRPNPSRAAL